MSEPRRIARVARRALSRGERAVVAHLVRVEGSHFRRPGARMVMTEGGDFAGAISGGCLEAELRRRAPEVIASHASLLLAFDTGSPEDVLWGTGLGCGGRLEILLSELTPDRARVLDLVVPDGSSGWCATVVGPGGSAATGDQVAERGGRVVSAADRTFTREATERHRRGGFAGRERWSIAGGETDVFVERWESAPRLVLLGSGDEMAALAVLARPLGWEVEIAAPRASSRAVDLAARIGRPLRGAETWPALCHGRTAIVIATHSFVDDGALLAEAVLTPARYIGLMGSRRRVERIRALAGALPSPGRVFGPAGLDVGGDSPAEVALSIASEIQGVLRSRGGRPLSAVSDPIHERRVPDVSSHENVPVERLRECRP